MQQRFPLFVAEDKHTKLEVPSEDNQVIQWKRGQPTVNTDPKNLTTFIPKMRVCFCMPKKHTTVSGNSIESLKWQISEIKSTDLGFIIMKTMAIDIQRVRIFVKPPIWCQPILWRLPPKVAANKTERERDRETEIQRETLTFSSTCGLPWRCMK